MARFCTNCGKPLREDMKFCVSCGAPVRSADPPQPPAQPRYVQTRASAQPPFAAQPQYAPPRRGQRTAAAPGAPMPPAQAGGRGVGAPAGAAVCAALLCVLCLPYLLKSLLFLLTRDSLGAVLCAVLDLLGVAACAAALSFGSRRATGKTNLPFAVLLAALLPGLEAADSLLAALISPLSSTETLLAYCGSFALKLLAAGLAVWALSGLFVSARGPKQGGRLLAWLCCVPAFFAPDLTALLWELSPFDDVISFFSTFALKALAAFLAVCAFSAAAWVLVKKRDKAPARLRQGGLVPLIAGLALVVLFTVVSLRDNARIPVPELAEDDAVSYVLDAELYLALGDMNGALSSYKSCAEHCEAWRAAANGADYEVPMEFRGDSTLQYLSYVNRGADDLRLYLAKNFDETEISLWCPLMIRKYAEKAENEELSDYEQAHLAEMLRLCTAEECFIFPAPTAEEIRAERDALESSMVFPEEYGPKIRMAEAIDQVQRGSYDIPGGLKLILDVAEEYPEELSFQYIAAYLGSQNLWDGAAHLSRTAEAVERYRSLWLAEFGQDATADELAELDSALADMLVNIKRYSSAIPLLENALARKPDDAGLLRQLAFCYSSNGETEKGYELSKRLYAAAGDDVGVIWSYFVGALKHGRQEEAIEAASRMADIVRTGLDGNKNHEDEVLFNLVLYLGISDNSSWTDYQYRVYDDGRTDPALLALLEQNEFLYNYVRAAYWERDRSFPAEALPFAQKALSMQEESGRLWYLNAMVHYDLGEFEEALACYQKADRLEPDDPSILFALANCYDALEDYQTAYDYCLRALAHFPAGVDHSYDNYGVSWHAAALLNRLKPYVEVND